uniref:Uncharacterized protein n=1 Tax=Solanum lycopersicum TaxID=4081 RepID=A0A3Q7FPE4_SOLLC
LITLQKQSLGLPTPKMTTAAGNGLFKFLSPKRRPQSTDIQAAAGWGVAAVTGALWVIQKTIKMDKEKDRNNTQLFALAKYRFTFFDPCNPWDFLRKTFIEKQEEEK